MHEHIQWKNSSGQNYTLTLILLEPKVISLCHQYRAKPVFTSMQSDRLYTVGRPTLSSHLHVPKMIMEFPKMEGELFHLRNFAWLGLTLKYF